MARVPIYVLRFDKAGDGQQEAFSKAERSGIRIVSVSEESQASKQFFSDLWHQTALVVVGATTEWREGVKFALRLKQQSDWNPNRVLVFSADPADKAIAEENGFQFLIQGGSRTGKHLTRITHQAVASARAEEKKAGRAKFEAKSPAKRRRSSNPVPRLVIA